MQQFFFKKKYQIRIRHFVAIVHKWETILLILKRKGQGSHNKLGQYKIGNTNRECVRRNKGKEREEIIICSKLILYMQLQNCSNLIIINLCRNKVVL
jgi:hypothetical protein